MKFQSLSNLSQRHSHRVSLRQYEKTREGLNCQASVAGLWRSGFKVPFLVQCKCHTTGKPRQNEHPPVSTLSLYRAQQLHAALEKKIIIKQKDKVSWGRSEGSRVAV